MPLPLYLPPPPPLEPPALELRQDEAEPVASVAPEPEGATLMPGDVEVKLRLGFDGFSAGPLSLLGAFVGWWELGACADVGVVHLSRFTLGVGGEAWYSRLWLLELLSEGLLSFVMDDDQAVDWKAANWGVAGRATFHYTSVRSTDLYLLGLIGPSSHVLEGHMAVGDYLLEGRAASAGLKGGVGLGASFTSDSGFVGGLELRYLLGYRFKKDQSLVLTDPDGEEEEVYEMKGAQKPPRGFSWVFHAGWRF